MSNSPGSHPLVLTLSDYKDLKCTRQGPKFFTRAAFFHFGSRKEKPVFFFVDGQGAGAAPGRDIRNYLER